MSKRVNRRRFLGLSAAAAASVIGDQVMGLDTRARRPNFVIIYADDQGYQDIGCFGAPLIKTPNLDRMAAEGMKLTSFYAAPVCTPSRAGLITGRYPVRCGLPTVLRPSSTIGLSAQEVTIAEALKTAGYATCCIGKWHLGWQKPFLPTRHGFDSYFGIPYSNDMGKPERGDPPVPLMRGESIIEQPARQDTLTERYTQEAIRFIRQNRSRPFFLYLPHTFPHVPLHAGERFRGRSAAGLYGDVIEELDWSTGQILDTIRELGLDANTLVVYTSDNGPWLVQKEHGGSALPLREGKGTTYEGGVRVPCIAWWRGHIPAGTKCDEMTGNMDLFPTFVRLAGGKMPEDRPIDGQDIWPLLAGEPGAVTPHKVHYYYRASNLEAVRAGKWKLICKAATNAGPAINALYDLEADLGETTDLYDRLPSVVRRLAAYAEAARDDIGDASRQRVGRGVFPPGKL